MGPEPDLLAEIDLRIRGALRPYHLSVTNLEMASRKRWWQRQSPDRHIDIEIVSPMFDTLLPTDQRVQAVLDSLQDLDVSLQGINLVVRTKSMVELL
jgi:stress-induced morphogen